MDHRCVCTESCAFVPEPNPAKEKATSRNVALKEVTFSAVVRFADFDSFAIHKSVEMSSIKGWIEVISFGVRSRWINVPILDASRRGSQTAVWPHCQRIGVDLIPAQSLLE